VALANEAVTGGDEVASANEAATGGDEVASLTPAQTGIIHKMVDFVLKNGRYFEEKVREREKANPK
jgi:hypothetical protein